MTYESIPLKEALEKLELTVRQKLEAEGLGEAYFKPENVSSTGGRWGMTSNFNIPESFTPNQHERTEEIVHQEIAKFRRERYEHH